MVSSVEQPALPFVMPEAEAARFRAWQANNAARRMLETAHARDLRRLDEQYRADIAAINVKYENCNTRD